MFEVQSETGRRNVQTSSEIQQPARKKQKHKQLNIRTLFAAARNQRNNKRGASSVNKEQGHESLHNLKKENQQNAAKSLLKKFFSRA